MGLPIEALADDYADGTAFYTRACEQTPWASATAENDATEAELIEPPLMHVYRPIYDERNPCVEWQGVLRGPYDDEERALGVFYRTSAGFNGVLAEPTNPDDPRWQCHAWMRSIHDLMYDVRKSFSAALQLEDDATLLIPPNNMVGILCWRAPNGGLVVYLDHHCGACGWCLGCRSFVRNREQAPVSWVYFIQSTDGGPVKIGRSASPIDRLSSLQTANPSRLRIVAKMAGGGAVERSMHALFAADRIRPDGEWFRASQALTAFMREIGGAK
jgi:hypothetical protein